MLRGWHYLPAGDNDPERPLPAATFLDLAPSKGLESPDWLCRPYFKGRPEPKEIAEKARPWLVRGGRVQLGNEPNHPIEQFGGGPAEYAAWFLDVANWLPPGSRLYYTGMSPGFPGWRDWYTHPLARSAIVRASGIAAHAYGNLAQMIEVVRFLAETFPGKPLWLAEVNFGAGQEVSRDVWAIADFGPFLDACAAIPEVEAVTYFAYRWPSPDMHLPTPVDGAGTAIEQVLRTWTPPAPKPIPKLEVPAVVDWCPFAERKPIARNYTPGRAGRSVRLIVDHIAEGEGSPFDSGWFNRDAGDDGSSAHFWISKTGAIEQYRPLPDTCWANGPKCKPDLTNPIIKELVAAGMVGMNSVSVAIEHAGWSGQPLTAAQVSASRRLHVWLGGMLTLPLDRTHVIGHYQIDKCSRAGCPGPTHPWEAILMPAAQPTANQVRDRTYALAEQLQATGNDWQRVGHPQMAEYVRTQGEAIKKTVVIGKGEK